MNIEFRVHGTLDGQAYWSATGADTATDSDYEYCARSYDSREESPSMDVEVVKRSDGGFCTYYTYLRSKNIVSTRKDAYFGMTIRIDDFICLDVVSMYALLELIFKKYMVGTLFTLEKDNVYHYNICKSFAEKDAELKSIEQTFGKYFELILAANVVQIPIPYKKKDQVCQHNNEDLDNNEACNTLLKGYRLCISPVFPTKQVQNKQAQLNEKVKNELNQVKSDYEGIIGDLKNEKGTLQQEIDGKQKEIVTLRAEVESYENLFGKIKPLVESLNSLLSEQKTNEVNSSSGDNPTEKSGGKINLSSKLHSFFSSKKRFAVVVGIFVLAIWAAGNAFYNAIKMNGRQIEDLKEQMDVQCNSASSDGVSTLASEVIDVEADADIDYSNFEIDILEKKTSDRGLKQKKTYTFEIKGAEEKQLEGTWYVNDIKLTDNKYYVSDKVGDMLSIEYRGSNNEKVGPRKVFVIE